MCNRDNAHGVNTCPDEKMTKRSEQTNKPRYTLQKVLKLIK